MKVFAETDAGSEEVELTVNGNNISVDIGGRSFEVEISEPEPNVYLVKKDAQIFETFSSPRPGAFGEMMVSVKNQTFNVRVTDPRQLRGSAPDAAGGDGLVEIRASMPGKIVRTLTEVGADIDKGQGVIVVEAMKMQNELKSPKRGVIKEILAADGATVSAGDVLVTIE